MESPGIHHVTAIAGDVQRCIDFYAGVLGMRLVKLTVNYDNPTSYHVYFGDGTGRPGTLLTFFQWPGAPRARLGTGMAAGIGLRIPADAAGYWVERLRRHGVEIARMAVRDRGEVIAFKDPDGLSLELVARAAPDDAPAWEGGLVPPGRAVREICGVTLFVKRAAETAAFLGRVGLESRSVQGVRFHCVAGDGVPIEVAEFPLLQAGSASAGAIHHVALRAPDAAAQEACARAVSGAGAPVTPVVDRTYFRSIYFREPGGVLFEVATDEPGFAVDEPVAALGSELKLPRSLESRRESIVRRLPPLRLPRAA